VTESGHGNDVNVSDPVQQIDDAGVTDLRAAQTQLGQRAQARKSNVAQSIMIQIEHLNAIQRCFKCIYNELTATLDAPIAFETQPRETSTCQRVYKNLNRVVVNIYTV
jgi:hypothetical protein